ncbi:hypothetical protein CYMTET_50158 [Cymbomonas tetramitiformis]|uniref:Uncharacterized protein n=1 Tax=Cymbomonas tetramitiformis TaxID=36881 RepID=A0AAE0BQM5_9CHLO|nr:hypothetical protein CYMTET_50158 [Cymbomonas tetramitiformis]
MEGKQQQPESSHSPEQFGAVEGVPSSSSQSTGMVPADSHHSRLFQPCSADFTTAPQLYSVAWTRQSFERNSHAADTDSHSPLTAGSLRAGHQCRSLEASRHAGLPPSCPPRITRDSWTVSAGAGPSLEVMHLLNHKG